MLRSHPGVHESTADPIAKQLLPTRGICNEADLRTKRTDGKLHRVLSREDEPPEPTQISLDGSSCECRPRMKKKRYREKEPGANGVEQQCFTVCVRTIDAGS